jgi:hypothetical protein
MRSSIFWFALLCGCGPEFAVVPHGGAPLITATQAGVYFTAFAEQWDGEPRDLANYVTPIAVDIYNGTGAEVRISYADFALTTGGGVRVPALNPFDMPAASAMSTIPGNPTLASEELKMGPLLAGPIDGPVGSILISEGHGGGGGGGGGRGGGGAHFSGGTSARGGYGRGYGGPRAGWSGGHYGPGARWGRGFYGVGGLRRWYGVGGLYWGGPWALKILHIV